MKIGIVTITNNGVNYGNQLQNYAVKRILENIGIDTINTLYNVDGVEFFASPKWMIKNKIKCFFKKGNYSFRKKEMKFISFGKKYLNYTKPFSGVLSESETNTYDYFICGSDQIWNLNFPCNNRHIPFIFLKFAPKNKCIAFSASLGVSGYSEKQNEVLKDGISNFKAVSVREDDGADLINKVTGEKPTVLLDPTMLIDKEDWEKIMLKPANVPKKYILCYFLGTISENVRAQVEQWAVMYNLEVVYLNKNEINNSSAEAGPQEFIYYFANAELVCTDSFHGTVFSIIFDNPFVVFERRDSKEKSNEQMGSRFKTLLKKFNLENRLYESITEENIFELKTDYFQKIMLEEKLKAESFLKNAFST